MGSFKGRCRRQARKYSRKDGEGNGNPLQYSCLENPMDGGAWQATVHGVAKSQTWLSNFTFHFSSASPYTNRILLCSFFFFFSSGAQVVLYERESIKTHSVLLILKCAFSPQFSLWSLFGSQGIFGFAGIYVPWEQSQQIFPRQGMLFEGFPVSPTNLWTD